MAGDVELYDQQKKPSATLVAGTGGAVPSRGDPLEITGEGNSGPQVGALSAPANFVGLLTEVPVDFDEDATYSEGDVVGEVTVEVPFPVHWFPADDTNAPTPGDAVVIGTGGALAYDNAGGDTADMIVGSCWRTRPMDEGTSDKVAVVRQKR